jgi:hypothetical protein
LEEIAEGVCSRGDYNCHAVLEDNEDVIADWWLQHPLSTELVDQQAFTFVLCNKVLDL